MIAGRASTEKQAPLKIGGQNLPGKDLPSHSALSWASLSEPARAGVSVYLGHLRISSRLHFFMEDDGEAGVESMEARRQEEFAHAWDVVVHSGYTCCTDFYWPTRRRQYASFNLVVFEDLMHVWVGLLQK